jgi:hypothetical protein
VRARTGIAALVAAALALGMLAAPAAVAAVDSPDDFSAADEYVETVPTARGPHVATRPHRSGASGLSRATAARLRRSGGRDAQLLAQLATSPALGAPQEHAAGARKAAHTKGRGRPGRGASTSTAVPAAAIDAVNDDGGIGRLMLVLLAPTALALVVLGHRRRRSRGRS